MLSADMIMQTKSRIWSDVSSGLGCALAIFAAWLLIYREGYGRLAWPLLGFGCVSMFAGFWFYIRAKGYNPAWAFLTFLLGPLVFFVFFYLPDRERRHESNT